MIADENFEEVVTMRVGSISPLRGFSSFKFLPVITLLSLPFTLSFVIQNLSLSICNAFIFIIFKGSADSIIVAIKSEEQEEIDSQVNIENIWGKNVMFVCKSCLYCLNK